MDLNNEDLLTILKKIISIKTDDLWFASEGTDEGKFLCIKESDKFLSTCLNIKIILKNDIYTLLETTEYDSHYRNFFLLNTNNNLVEKIKELKFNQYDFELLKLIGNCLINESIVNYDDELNEELFHIIYSIPLLYHRLLKNVYFDINNEKWQKFLSKEKVSLEEELEETVKRIEKDPKLKYYFMKENLK
jgi:hypothetical protein